MTHPRERDPLLIVYDEEMALSNIIDSPQELSQPMMEKAVMSAATLAVGTSLTSMVMESHPSVCVSGVAGSIIAPCTVMQQKKLAEYEGLSQKNEKMESEANSLQEENERLCKSVNDLQDSIHGLCDLEETFDTIQKIDGQNLDALDKQLRQSRAILGKMTKYKESMILQNIFSVLLKSDMDKMNTKLSEKDICEIMKRMNDVRELKSVKKDYIRKVIRECDYSMDAITQIVHNLLHDDITKEEQMFVFRK